MTMIFDNYSKTAKDHSKNVKFEQDLINGISCYLYPYIQPHCICLWHPKCLGNFFWCVIASSIIQNVQKL